MISESDQKLLRHGDAVPTRVLNLDSGELVHISTDEEAAFRDWAAVETLRHSGVRIEEMCELTHLSIRQYQRANGEVIALLVIAPSKTDRERVIPMSAELFHVIASIIRRHGRRGKPIPLFSRYDPHDKAWSAPMPFLFQRQNGASGSKIFNPGTIPGGCSSPRTTSGVCGRPYGTPRQHEHACIRCPMLHVNPKTLAGLTELEADLLQRRAQAEAEGWIGEIEGIDLTLTFLRAKRDETRRRAQRPPVDLGIPTTRRTKEDQ
ncbi:hypothetical protein PV963_36775 [Streptomyces coeruleorubidus]|uniref:tyrosine-type recombinase/integrase n=1 Tax=Streptomyces coeruleorubidus TaxID=116188 RepID=UPI00237F0636|nr:tyrosine-type recombinase/integrase [Streptomyces coeruleorubidus]WDV55516.1 hypothetical protein PV963_36775 [Streptomyces coeruleorubidus]